MNKLTVRDIACRGRRVLVRFDLNVPLTKDGKVGDDTRIRASLPTLKHLLDQGARVVMTSHLGRPDGERDPKASLAPVAARMGELMGRPIAFAPDCVGPEAEKAVAALRDGDALVLENVRFHPGETKNDPAFARELAKSGELYVNDAFGSAHRAHASTVGVTTYLQPAVAGFLMEKELEFLGRILGDPPRPLLAILGGAKISGKIDVVQHLLGRVNGIIFGGGMANTMMRAKGLVTGDSLVEEDRVVMARDVLEAAKKAGVEVLLPLDVVAARDLAAGAETRTVDAAAVEPGWKIADIGPRTLALYTQHILRAKSVFWNGPVGVFEIPPFDEGTNGIARVLADATVKGVVTVVGGGDSAAALAKAKLEDRVSHVSTGGGASLEFMEGKELPGVAALTSRTAAAAGRAS